MDKKIEIINNWYLPKVFQELENGNIRIPKFQRDYVWPIGKIVKLLNSIYNQYPIGTFFLWDTGSEMKDFCRDMSEFGLPSTPSANQFSFVIDGQQRLTSLFLALKGKTFKKIDYSTMCFNLAKGIFLVQKAPYEKDVVPIKDIFDQVTYSDLLVKYSGAGKTDIAKTLIQCNYILNNYPISIVKTVGMGLECVVDIFERINQEGRKLSLFDLVHASTWCKDFDLREKISDFNDLQPVALFGELDNELFVQSLALDTFDDASAKAQLQLKSKDCIKNWDHMANAMRLAIDFVRGLGVKLESMLPYPGMLSVVQYYYFKSKKKSMSASVRKLFADWFWSSVFSLRYTSSLPFKQNDDAQWVRDVVNGIEKSRIFRVNLTTDDIREVRMSQRSALKNGVLCLMANNGPVDFDDGSTVVVDNTNVASSNAKENHHFFPYSLHKQFALTKNQINTVLNFVFITKRLNGEISNKDPKQYLSDFASGTSKLKCYLEKHFIGAEACEAAMQNDFAAFINARGRTILDKINEVCHVIDGSQTILAEDVAANLADDEAS